MAGHVAQTYIHEVLVSVQSSRKKDKRKEGVGEKRKKDKENR